MKCSRQQGGSMRSSILHDPALGVIPSTVRAESTFGHLV